HVVAVRPPATARILVVAEERGPRRSEETHRSRHGHPGHRQDLPTQRGPRGDALFGRAAPWRKNRHHHVRRRQPRRAGRLLEPAKAASLFETPLAKPWQTCN